MYYLPLDLETTGLRPTEDRICEVAWTLLKPDFSQHLLEYRSFVPTPSIAAYQLLEDNDFVREMHGRTGLLDEMEAISNGVQESLELSDIEDVILADINAGVPDDEPVALLGSSVHFDKQFIAHWMPRLHERLHYRVFDTSTMEAFVEGFIIKPDELVNENQHRAVNDIQEDVALVQHYRWQMAVAQQSIYLLADLHPESGLIAAPEVERFNEATTVGSRGEDEPLPAPERTEIGFSD